MQLLAVRREHQLARPMPASAPVGQRVEGERRRRRRGASARRVAGRGRGVARPVRSCSPGPTTTASATRDQVAERSGRRRSARPAPRASARRPVATVAAAVAICRRPAPTRSAAMPARSDRAGRRAPSRRRRARCRGRACRARRRPAAATTAGGRASSRCSARGDGGIGLFRDRGVLAPRAARSTRRGRAAAGRRRPRT